jgi:hypothetical protein
MRTQLSDIIIPLVEQLDNLYHPISITLVWHTGVFRDTSQESGQFGAKSGAKTSSECRRQAGLTIAPNMVLPDPGKRNPKKPFNSNSI